MPEYKEYFRQLYSSLLYSILLYSALLSPLINDQQNITYRQISNLNPIDQPHRVYLQISDHPERKPKNFFKKKGQIKPPAPPFPSRHVLALLPIVAFAAAPAADPAHPRQSQSRYHTPSSWSFVWTTLRFCAL